MHLSESYSLRALVTGYFAFGEENLSTVYPEHNVNFEDKDLGDFKEGIDFGPQVDPADPHYGEPLRTPNRWPDEVPGQDQNESEPAITDWCLCVCAKALVGKEWKEEVRGSSGRFPGCCSNITPQSIRSDTGVLCARLQARARSEPDVRRFIGPARELV